MQTKHKVAVYGTLKRNQWNNYLMKDQTFIDAGQTKEKYTLHSLMVFKEPATAPVVIDLYEVNEKQLLGPLDSLESNGTVYNREKIPIVLNDGTEEEAWLYFGLPAFASARFKKDNPPKPADGIAYNWGT